MPARSTDHDLQISHPGLAEYICMHRIRVCFRDPVVGRTQRRDYYLLAELSCAIEQWLRLTDELVTAKPRFRSPTV